MRVKLGDVVDKIVGNEDRLTTNLQYYVGGEHIESSRIAIYNKGELNEKTRNILGYQFHYPFQPGDVLFMTKNPYLKKCGCVDFEGICSIATFIIRTKNEQILAQRFLAVVLQTDRFWNYLEANKSGSVNYFITWKTLERYEFELPEMEEQIRIADVIWTIEESRRKYEALRNQTDTLIKAQFDAMFSDTVKKPIGEFCEIKARIGWQGLKKSEFLDEGEYYLVTGIDFVGNRVDFEHCKFVTEERYTQDENIQLKEEDVLVTKDGTIGKVAIIEGLPGPTTLNSGIFVVRSSNKLDRWFLFYALQSTAFNNFIASCKTGSTVPHLNQKAFINFEIPLPDKDKQQEFVSFAKEADKSKERIDQTILDLNNLARSIMREKVI